MNDALIIIYRYILAIITNFISFYCIFDRFDLDTVYVPELNWYLNVNIVLSYFQEKQLWRETWIVEILPQKSCQQSFKNIDDWKREMSLLTRWVLTSLTQKDVVNVVQEHKRKSVLSLIIDICPSQQSYQTCTKCWRWNAYHMVVVAIMNACSLNINPDFTTL